MNFDICITYSC